MNTNNSVLLGDFLRRKRENLRPEMVGLPTAKRKRTPGLRREDVADLAGISTVWYSKIERGKVLGVSPSVLTALSQVLQLNDLEQRYLMSLANHAESLPKRACQHASPHTIKLLTLLNPLPVLLKNQYADIIDCNESFNQLCGFHIPSLPPEERNYIYLILAHPQFQQCFLATAVDERLAQITQMASHLRGTNAAQPNDPILTAHIRRFQAISPEFAHAWQANQVSHPDPLAHTLMHAKLGAMSFQKQMLCASGGDNSAQFSIYHPQLETDYVRLAALSAVVDTQNTPNTSNIS